MASQLTPEQRSSYSAIIDEILAASDLNTISAKRIRKGLQERVQDDLTPQKAIITDLIMERFDRASGKQEETVPFVPAREPSLQPPVTVNGGSNGRLVLPPPSAVIKRKSSEDDDDLSSVVDEPSPKKVKKSKPRSEVESDEMLAARLQAELNQSARATRGGGVTKRKTPAKKDRKPKKKSAAKVRAEDDSDLDSGDGEKPEREKKGGFHKLMILSPPLAELLGEPALSRPQTVKRIWEYVKARDLQDPKDKRQIMCDDAMRAVFKSDKIHMFTMNKVLATQLYPADEAE